MPRRPTVSRSHAGADHHSKGGELQEGKDRGDDKQCKDEIDRTENRIADGVGFKADQRAEIERANQQVGGRGRDRVCAVVSLDDFLKNDGQAKGHKDLVGMGPLVEMFDQAAFHGKADADHDGDRKQDGQGDGPFDD